LSRISKAKVNFFIFYPNSLSSWKPVLLSERTNNIDVFLPFQALHYLVLISEVEETEIFKICLEYWNSLASDLYRENPFSSTSNPLLIQNQQVPPRRQLYLAVLTKVVSNKTLNVF